MRRRWGLDQNPGPPLSPDEPEPVACDLCGEISHVIRYDNDLMCRDCWTVVTRPADCDECFDLIEGGVNGKDGSLPRADSVRWRVHRSGGAGKCAGRRWLVSDLLRLSVALRKLRRAHGVSQRQWGRESGVDHRTISSYETARRIGSMQIGTLVAMVGAFGYDLDSFSEWMRENA